MEFKNSTLIKELEYAGTDLNVTFQSGRTYQFKEVPETVAQGFTTAESAGKYFNTEIKNKFAYEEVKTA